MRVPLVLASLLLALAGCSDGGTDTDAADAEVPDIDAVGADETAAPVPVLEEVPVLFEGNLGVSSYACEYQETGVCHGFALVSDETDLHHAQPSATLVAATLTLEWSAATPATDTLAIGLMRMGGNSTHVEIVEGTSPLTIEAADLDLLLGEDDVVHVYVYNARGNIHEPPFVLYATPDQPFTVEGTLTMRTT